MVATPPQALPRSDEVHVWSIRLDRPAPAVHALLGVLDEDERDRAERFRAPLVRDRFVVAHAARREIVGAYVGIDPRAVLVTHRPCARCGGAHGKPVVWGRGQPLATNLAHSGDTGLLAVGGGPEVGVDVEEPRQAGGLDASTRLWLGARTRVRVATLPVPARQRELLRCWTRVEAVLKGTGEGLNRTPTSVDLEPAGTGTWTTGDDPVLGRWYVRDLVVGDAAAAIATRAPVTITGHEHRPEADR